jgi:hypothetical protein
MHAYAVSTAKQVGKQQKVHTKRKFKKDQNKHDLSERNMSLEDKLLFRRRKWISCDRFSTMECGHFRPPVKLIRSVP